jgi:glycosyltransferase involved in cell wall biosynthesis
MSKVSVIIPVFNGEATVRDAVDSVLGQDARDFEVMVVDDGSTDSTPAIIESYGTGVRHLRQANSGPARQRRPLSDTSLIRGNYDHALRWKNESGFGSRPDPKDIRPRTSILWRRSTCAYDEAELRKTEGSFQVILPRVTGHRRHSTEHR